MHANSKLEGKKNPQTKTTKLSQSYWAWTKPQIWWYLLGSSHMIQYFSLYFSRIFRDRTATTCSGPQIVENTMEHFLNIPYSELFGLGFFVCLDIDTFYSLLDCSLFLKRPKCLLQNSSLDLHCTDFSLLYRMKILKIQYCLVFLQWLYFTN